MARIGIFDSGVGGLTVVNAVMQRLPEQSIVYLGDTARVPYGSKSAQTIRRYADNAARFLLDRDVDLLLFACNTASAYAIDALEQTCPVPVLGAVEPGARAAVRATKTGSIGVIGTLGTIRSGAYVRAIHAQNADLRIALNACPLLVPLVEEGWLDGEVPLLVARRYLDVLHAQAPELDVLVLGCTHYPLLRPLLLAVAQERWGHDITLVDSAAAMAEETETLLAVRGLETTLPATFTCAVTDDARIDEIGARFLGRSLGPIERVDL
ncbi:MAG: glutamate racemase [Polyangia bacterium]